MKDILMETERLVLRELAENDLPALYEYACDPEVFRYQESGPFNENQTRSMLEAMMAYRKADPRMHFELAVLIKDMSRLIGNCGLQITSVTNRIGLADCSLNRQYWYNGYAVEAVRALLEFSFTGLKLHRIFATCDPGNLASQRVLIKLGMKNEGCLRQDKQVRGRWRDSLLYAILEDEWKASMERISH